MIQEKKEVTEQTVREAIERNVRNCERMRSNCMVIAGKGGKALAVANSYAAQVLRGLAAELGIVIEDTED